MSSHRRRTRADPPRKRPRVPESDGTPLVELERFPHASLQKWLQVSAALGRLHTSLYFGLEAARQANSDALIDALRAGMRGAFEFKGWSRIVDYRYRMEPL